MITGKIKPLILLRNCKFLPLALLLCYNAPATAQSIGDSVYAIQTSILKSGHIPDSVFLLLYGCSINKLPDDIGRLHHLRELGLTGYPIPAAELNRIQKALPAYRIVFSR